MILTDLKIHNLRNLSTLQLNLHPHFTFISGANGSGKTSILEALYLLSCGHSFRTREIAPIISKGQQVLTVFASALDNQSISIQKSVTTPTQIKLNQAFCSTTSQLAYALPAQIIYSDIFSIIDAGPSVRRSVLDWGLFHVKPSYLQVWKDYRQVLKQRNALLKQVSVYQHFIPWDKQLEELAWELHCLRAEYFTELHEEFQHVLQAVTNVSCSLSYYKGWDKKETNKMLGQILRDHFVSDLQRQYTQLGAHQADLVIESEDSKAKTILSRGQQKIILIALKLAQVNLLKRECLFLLDDFTAELDSNHQTNLLEYFSAHSAQFVITSTDSLSIGQGIHSFKHYSIANGTVLSKDFF